MFVRRLSLTGKRRLMAISLTGVGIIAVIAVLAVGFFHTQAAFGSGSGGGGGGGCVSSSGPVCTITGNNAFADFGSISSDGCILTDASLQPFDQLTRPGSATSQAAFVSISQFDICTGTQLVAATNQDPTTETPDFMGTIQFGTNLSTATLSTATVVGTAPMVDSISNTTFTATVNVTWQGFGPTTTNIDSFHFRMPGLILNTHFNATSRAAEAAGTITDATGTNLATPATLNASLADSSSGAVQITHS